MTERSHWGVDDPPALVAELDRDLADRQASLPGLVAKGRFRQEEADWLLALLAEIRRDLDVAFGPPPWTLAAPRFAWADKVRWMKGELERRERDYPDRVAKGRLTAAEADRRIRAMRSLVMLYWSRGFGWSPSPGAGKAQAMAEARAHIAAVDQEANAQGSLLVEPPRNLGISQ